MKKIAIIWSIEDVQEIRPDLSLAQCQEVLRMVERRHDANIGVNWEFIGTIADDLYPAPRRVKTASL